MEAAFSQLRSEATSKDLRTCIETMVDIYRNILSQPTNTKYRSLRTSNSKFNHLVWRFKGAQNFMLTNGWREDGDRIVMDSKVDFGAALDYLIENRAVKPSADEWVADTKQIIVNPEKEREDKLREEAFKQKEKQMIELKKSMKEDRDIAAAIKAEHRNDLSKRRVHKAQKAVPLPSERLNSRV
ncbi:uncharacterized protein LOC108680026 isoform X1 [Hyalella azteca]|uniref:Uncharacterized protein LOC108680026 isoform X1 n=1 Tax=Hyalella azteca TaxID=294128 RepID=A0A8B7PG36_HYAAZ|nr:uncharacterized protein LOC108680026 isoform X1 [Hyalella azteca]